MTPKLCHSLDSASENSDLGKSTIRKFIDSGELRSFKVGNRRLITHETLEQFVKILEQRGFTETPRGESS
ncbi:excisionase family DNA-binding protein [Pseudomonadota bacterium]